MVVGSMRRAAKKITERDCCIIIRIHKCVGEKEGGCSNLKPGREGASDLGKK